MGADRESLIQHGAMGADPGVSFGAGQDHQPRHDAARPPAQPARRIERGSLVPTDLALQGAKVIEASLDLDEQQRASVSIVCEEIDPSVRARVDDLDFPDGEEAGCPKSAADVRGAPGVDKVSGLACSMDDRRPDVPVDFDIERGGDLRYDVQRRVGSAHLDARDIASRDSDSVGQFILGHPQAGPVVSAPQTDTRTQRWHRSSQTYGAYLGLTR